MDGRTYTGRYTIIPQYYHVTGYKKQEYTTRWVILEENDHFYSVILVIEFQRLNMIIIVYLVLLLTANMLIRKKYIIAAGDVYNISAFNLN